MGAPRKAGPWLAETLEEFSFGFEDLVGLGRISSALARTKVSRFDALAPLKHLRRGPDGRLRLAHPPEVRSLVAASDALPASVDMAARWLIAVREDRGQATAGVMSVLSLALTEALGRRE
ncbi:unnamed protein product [Prorocentrum cordatum]|uniref:Uncharacterized protein n=1 Tax=Prorocentrum cordatum TaxID=2364126 RepID=A0ABN9RKN1_9DINO|nr:unnamed protein product [Polarella glacialis]